MKSANWVYAVVDCLRDRQFGHETVREAFCSFTDSSNGLGFALATTALGMCHRFFALPPMWFRRELLEMSTNWLGITSPLIQTHDRQLSSR